MGPVINQKQFDKIKIILKLVKRRQTRDWWWNR